MIDHVGFAIADAEQSRRFYEAALTPLGISLIMTVTPEQSGSDATHHGFGSDGKAFFWIGDGKDAGESTHIAFTAETKAAVDSFHAAALGAGGRDNGAPGPRPHYGPAYYGAFVRDPDGNNIEAVYRARP